MGYGVWLHGEGVSAGTVLAAELLRRMGLIAPADVDRVAALFRRAGLPVVAPALGYDAYMNFMGVDKKAEAGRIRFVLLRNLGEAFISGDYDPAALRATLTPTSQIHNVTHWKRTP